ncbi:hypothetical protein DFH06DRAFT_1149047 [Mycena polygramma]|nr:hypothetical protein DFH06DRAFT_1149047 [Mycena polygramma]
MNECDRVVRTTGFKYPNQDCYGDFFLDANKAHLQLELAALRFPDVDPPRIQGALTVLHPSHIYSKAKTNPKAVDAMPGRLQSAPEDYTFERCVEGLAESIHSGPWTRQDDRSDKTDGNGKTVFVETFVIDGNNNAIPSHGNIWAGRPGSKFLCRWHGRVRLLLEKRMIVQACWPQDDVKRAQTHEEQSTEYTLAGQSGGEQSQAQSASEALKQLAIFEGGARRHLKMTCVKKDTKGS